MPQASQTRFARSARRQHILALCWLPALLIAFAPAQTSLPLSHQAWSTEEGLPDASVHQVLQSRVGYLWIATEGGVARFDGASFQVFRHSTEPAFTSDDVSSVAEDKAGTLWFGTADGLVEHRGDAFRRFREADGLPSARVLSVAAAGDGSLLALTAAGLIRLQGEAVHPPPPGLPQVTTMEAASDGSVRLFTAEGTALRYAGGVFSPERRPPTDGEPLLGEVNGPHGTVWVQTAHRVSVTAPGTRRVWPATPEQARLRVMALAVDADGAAWIGTNHGLFRQPAIADAAPEPIDALRNESILALTTDREGDLWIGTEASGLHVLRPRAFRSEGAAVGEAVTSVLGAADGGVWFGTRDTGVQRVLRSGTTQPGASARLTSLRVLSLARGSEGDLWVGTPDGLNHVTAAGQVQAYTSADGLPDDFVRSLLVDGQGVVWAGTRRGLVRLERGRITVLTRGDGLPSESIGPLLEGGHGELWIGTSGGLALLRKGRLTQVTPLAREGSAIITALAGDGVDGLWMGVHGAGLFHWSTGRLTPVTAPGLPREITALHADSEGFLWIRGPEGVYRAAGGALRECGGGSGRGSACAVAVDVFGAAEGMPSGALAAEGTPQIAEGAGGQLWFSTQKGLAVADPAHLPPRGGPPPVAVQRLTVDGVAVAVAGGETRVGPGHSRYVFDYAALSYRLPSGVRYRYRLEGFDREWVDAGAARSAYYTGLAPGTYRFQVLAANGNGLPSDPGGALTLRILPPLYRRWWFYALVLLLAAALVLATLRLRDRAVGRRFALVLEERNRMAREIHDTLAQDFVSVSLQLDIASGHLRGQRYEQATTQLQATRALVKEGLQAARQSIWNLRANAGERSLPTRLTTLAARFSFEGKPPQLSIGGTFRKLAPALEEEILRIAGESLSNADRHAGATEVKVELRYAPAQLWLRVHDNGRGFSPEAALGAEGHYGVRGMYERAAALGAELRMVSSPGQGTTVTLGVPLRAGEVMNA